MSSHAKENSPPPHDHAGHRQRLKERFDRAGFAGFSEHEILELALFYVIPKRDTKPAAKNLLNRFGSIEAVLAAKREHLLEVRGVGNESVRFFRMLRSLTEQIMRTKAHGTAPQISSVSELMRYLSVSMANLTEEQFRVVFVDHANAVLTDEVISQGVEDQTAVFPKQVVKRALAHSATGIVVAHNHPTGLVKPSQADRDLTRALKLATSALDIRLLDHIIIGREGKGYFSFRENGLLV